MAGRRCIDCDAPLKPHERGALCSPCLYGYICSGPADQQPADPDTGRDNRVPRTEPTSLDRRRARRGF